jgi:2-(3-amino-3-carboxypropyl)histidine synthase
MAEEERAAPPAPPPPPQTFSARDGGHQHQQQQSQHPAGGGGIQQAAVAAASIVPSAAASAAPRPSCAAAVHQQVPDAILHDPLLRQAKSVLPSNYNFEVEKTVWRVRQSGAKVVALQLPEGLLLFALALSDIVERFGGAKHCLVMADVTYGACCVDDLSARALGCDLLVHYGHSCLVPVGVTAVPCMYVFVDVAVDVEHLVGTVRLNFPPVLEGREQREAAGVGEQEEQEGAMARAGKGQGQADAEEEDAAGGGAAAAAGRAGRAGGDPTGRPPTSPSLPMPVRCLALAGTIQFSGAIAAARAALLAGEGEGEGGEGGAAAAAAPYPRGSLIVPKSRPLSPGEVLGCTAPRLPRAAPAGGDDGGSCCGGGGCGEKKESKTAAATTTTTSTPPDALVFVADGRFHLEAMMIANPGVPAYRYDPYSRELTRERYAHRSMRAARRRAVEAARRPGSRWGVVLGTLGRQGNPRLMRLLQEELGRAGGYGGAGGQGEAAEEGGAAAATSLPPKPAAPPSSPPPLRPVLAATVLLSEVTPQKLRMIGHVDVWVQVACPRLSIDWGEGFDKPTLTPYEALVALGRAPADWWDDGGEEEEEEEGEEGEGAAEAATGAVGRVSLQPSARREERRKEREARRQQRPLGDYPMDYYAADGGEWSSTYHRRPAVAAARVR